MSYLAMLFKSKLGRVLTAIRDAESRVMFSGYNTVALQTFYLDFISIFYVVLQELYMFRKLG